MRLERDVRYAVQLSIERRWYIYLLKDLWSSSLVTGITSLAVGPNGGEDWPPSLFTGIQGRHCDTASSNSSLDGLHTIASILLGDLDSLPISLYWQLDQMAVEIGFRLFSRKSKVDFTTQPIWTVALTDFTLLCRFFFILLYEDVHCIIVPCIANFEKFFRSLKQQVKRIDFTTTYSGLHLKHRTGRSPHLRIDCYQQ